MEYITSKDKHKFFIEVVDFHNFLVVKGFSNDKNVIDLSIIQDEFKKNYPELFVSREHFNLIDLIEYQNNSINENNIKFEYFNSDRPIYHPEVIDYYQKNLEDKPNESTNEIKYIDFDEKIIIQTSESLKLKRDNNVFFDYPSLSVKSSFPYGFSELSKMKILFYYGEYISYNLFKILLTDKLIIEFFKVNDDSDELFNINIISNSQYKDSDLNSLILDVFDFNIENFKFEKLLGYDFQKEIDFPFEQKPWLVRDKVKDLIIF